MQFCQFAKLESAQFVLRFKIVFENIEEISTEFLALDTHANDNHFDAGVQANSRASTTGSCLHQIPALTRSKMRWSTYDTDLLTISC